jgi:hypothetical protein
MLSSSSSPVATLKQRGYHMTEEDQQRNQDAARGKVARLQIDLDNATEHALNLAAEYQSLAELLRINPTNIDLGSYADNLIGHKKLVEVVEDIKRSEKEVQGAVRHARKLGVAL